MDNTKAGLRNRLRLQRQGKAIHFNPNYLLESPEFVNSKIIASYYSYGDEPSTIELNRSILNLGKILLLPVLRPDSGLDFRIWDGDESKLAQVGNVKEPTGEKYLGKIDLMIVPSLAVDGSGFRLGQGGGSYDRALKEYPSFAVTLVYGDEVIDSLPIELHDQSVAAALTPEKFLRF